VNGKRLKFLRCTIATGGRPIIPSLIEGINEIPYYTSENIFNLT
jgi:pyruvate/2-oxoglutarate dehydrogenase complex dihydrolipoamide dehydrogenase (E3) component